MNRLEETLGRHLTLEQIIGRKLTDEESAWFSKKLLGSDDEAPTLNAPPKSAADILREAAAVIEQRAAVRELPDGERSMARTVQAYNALTGSTLSELDGWIFMCVLKLARGTAGAPQVDDFTDLGGYAALAAERVQQ